MKQADESGREEKGEKVEWICVGCFQKYIEKYYWWNSPPLSCSKIFKTTKYWFPIDELCHYSIAWQHLIENISSVQSLLTPCGSCQCFFSIYNSDNKKRVFKTVASCTLTVVWVPTDMKPIRRCQSSGDCRRGLSVLIEFPTMQQKVLVAKSYFLFLRPQRLSTNE